MRIDFAQIDFSLMGGSARRLTAPTRVEQTQQQPGTAGNSISVRRQVNMISPPARYYGRFSEFYERYVEPNLPSPDRVQAFDLQLRQHLSDEDPVHVVRYVSGQTRGTVYRTGEGWRIFPTDNSPGDWRR